jgi:hypothetical protein
MIKIPTYIDCLAKAVSFLGLDYSDEENKTGKFRIKEQKTFFNQGKIYTEQYVPKILELFAGEDEKKRKLIDLFLTVSESFIRFLNNQEFCSAVTNKKMMYELLIFCYIPNVAYFFSYYQKKFGISDCLIQKNFMLPILENGKVTTPTKRLKTFLNGTRKQIKLDDIDGNIIAVLTTYILKLDDNTATRYQTYEKIISKINEIPELKEFEKNEISLLFRSAIISERIYKELFKCFEDENLIIYFVDHFFNCFKASENLLNEKNDSGDGNLHENFMRMFHENFCCELQKEKEKEKYSIDNRYLLERLLVNRNEKILPIIHCFNSNLFESESMNNPDEANSAEFKHPHLNILNLLGDLNIAIFRSKNFLSEKEISHLFQEIKEDKFFELYQHRYLFCKAHCYLAENDFENALKLFKQTAAQCEKITAAPIQFKTAKKIITLKLLLNKKHSFDHLNQYVKMIEDVHPEEFFNIGENINGIPKEDKYRHDYLYLGKMLKIITDFNSKGYARYEGIECVKINLFEKVEKFVKDFYELYDASHITESEENRIEVVIKKLTTDRGAKYKISDNLVTLYSFKALDVFEPTSFTHIYQFCLDSKIESENITKLRNNRQTLNLIFSALSTLCAPQEPKSIPYIIHI